MSCTDPANHMPCPQCDGEIDRNRTVPIRVPRVDADGFPSIDRETGELLQVTIPLPMHVNDLAHSRLDPTGLVPAACGHGLPVHPDPDIQASTLGRIGLSWVRSKYLLAGGGLYGKCVVDRGDPRPADLTAGRA